GDAADKDQMFEADISNQSSVRPEDELVAEEEKAKALRLLDKIDVREANILRLHYGLDNNKPLTLKQIGNKLGLTRERIRQIHREALTKLYEYMEEQ
ncbi:MAG: RNA polymerase sigma factor RpoD/SigA, partial [Planctomycetota bacterium]